MIVIPLLGHGLFPWQSAVVEGVHVDDLLRFYYDRWLRLVFEPALALEGHPQFVHHGIAEGPLHEGNRKKKTRMGFWPLPESKCYGQMSKTVLSVGSLIM